MRRGTIKAFYSGLGCLAAAYLANADINDLREQIDYSPQIEQTQNWDQFRSAYLEKKMIGSVRLSIDEVVFFGGNAFGMLLISAGLMNAVGEISESRRRNYIN